MKQMTILAVATIGIMTSMCVMSPEVVPTPKEIKKEIIYTPRGNGELDLEISPNITSANKCITISFTEKAPTNVNYGEMIGYLNRTFEEADIYFKLVADSADIPVVVIDEREGKVGHAQRNGYAFNMAAYVDLSYGVDIEAKSYTVAHEIGHLLGLPHGDGLMRPTAPRDVNFCSINIKQAKKIKEIL